MAASSPVATATSDSRPLYQVRVCFRAGGIPMGLDFGGGRLAEPRLPGAHMPGVTACEIRRSARQPGCQCDRLCRARRGRFCRSDCLGASGAAAAAGRGATSLNSRLASNLQQAIIHTRSSAERAEPGRAGAHPTPAAAQTAAGPGFAAGLGSASLCRQARCSAGRTCQPVRRRHRTRQRSGGNRPHRHPRCCLCRGTRLLAPMTS